MEFHNVQGMEANLLSMVFKSLNNLVQLTFPPTALPLQNLMFQIVLKKL